MSKRSVAVVIASALCGCYQAGGQGADGDAGAPWGEDASSGPSYDCAEVCDVEAACSEGFPAYSGWAACMEECEEGLGAADPAELACVFACPDDVGSAPTPEGCQYFRSCVNGCRGVDAAALCEGMCDVEESCAEVEGNGAWAGWVPCVEQCEQVEVSGDAWVFACVVDCLDGASPPMTVGACASAAACAAECRGE